MKKLNKLSGILLIALVTITLNSCKKEDKPVIFPVKFYSERVDVTSTIRMYTKDGEIKDPQKIAKYTSGIVYFNAENDQVVKGTLAVTFASQEKAFFGENENAQKFDVRQSGDQFLFTSEMEVMEQENQNDFRDHIFKYRSVINPLPSGNVLVREMRVSYGNYKEMHFPILAYFASSGDGSTFYRSEGGLATNEFDETAISYMTANDTLAVKVYSLVCKSR